MRGNMSKEKTDNGHYVPKIYLRSFAYKDDKCYVYDKIQSKYYQSNVDNIMAERYFYDIPGTIFEELEHKGVQHNIDTQLLERTLGSIVDNYCELPKLLCN